MKKWQYNLHYHKQRYELTYDYYWLDNNQSIWQNFNINNYRQSILKIINQSEFEIEKYKNRMERQIEVNSFLQKIYFFIQFHCKNKK